GVKLSAMMPVFVVSEGEILPHRIRPEWRYDLARQVFVSQRRQRVVTGLVTFARVFLAIGDGLQGRSHRLAFRLLRYGFIFNLGGELPLLDSLSERALHPVKVQDKVAYRTRARLRTIIQVFIRKRSDQPKRHSVNHLEISALSQERLFVHFDLLE